KPAWGLNDFDQARTGSPERDLARLATSAVLWARARHLSLSDQQKIVESLGEHYLDAIEDQAKGHPAPPYVENDDAHGAVKAALNNAGHSTRKDQLQKLLADPKATQPVFKHTDEVVPVTPAERQGLTAALGSYSHRLGPGSEVKIPIEVLDVARKLG